MNILIAGCGRLGAELATRLDHLHHTVTVVDVNPQAFRRLESGFTGRAIVGTCIDEDVLISANIEDADVFLAVTDGDNTNLMAAQVARRVFDVPQVAARVYDPVRAEIFAEMGIAAISPTVAIADILLDAVDLDGQGRS